MPQEWWIPVLIICLFMIICGLASAVDLKQFVASLKEPKGILVGLLCQYGMLPLTAWALTIGFNYDYYSAVALILTATCPGGILSNFFAFLIGADLPLSVAMTTASTILSFAFIPLNVLLYIELALDKGKIPLAWFNLLISVIVLVIGIICGLLISWKEVAILKRILGVLSPLCLIFIVIVALYDNLTSDYPLNQLGWKYWIASLVLTTAGWLFGLLFALLWKMKKPSAVAVGIETSNQSTGVAIAILALSLADDPEAYDRVVSIPGIYTLLTWGVNLVFLVIFYYLGWVDDQTEDDKSTTCCTLIDSWKNKSSSKVSESDDEYEKEHGDSGVQSANSMVSDEVCHNVIVDDEEQGLVGDESVEA